MTTPHICTYALQKNGEDDLTESFKCMQREDVTRHWLVWIISLVDLITKSIRIVSYSPFFLSVIFLQQFFLPSLAFPHFYL